MAEARRDFQMENPGMVRSASVFTFLINVTAEFMKPFIPFLLAMIAFSCNQQKESVQLLQKRMDSLQAGIAGTYKPGFGDFMSSVQVHHNKLWFAGQNQNWRLADFEVHEIMEAVTDIQLYQSERKESQLIEMILPALDSVNRAIQQKNTALFNNSYVLLTNTCNRCHRDVDFEFNVVKIPETPPFNNQDFKKSNNVP